MTRGGRRLAALFAVTVLLAAACGDDDDATDVDDAAPDDADEAAECTEDLIGGSVTMGTFSELAGMDPVVSRGTGVAGGIEAIAFYDTLVRYDADNDEYVPHLAESLEPNEDYDEWTLTLRDGVTFGNGDPLTAEAVQDSFARHQDPALQSTQFLQAISVTDMEVVDELTLVFTLDGPWPRFPYMLANLGGMITNPAVVEERGDDFNTNPEGAGAGPYEVERYAPGDELILRAKDDYWGGPVCIEQLRFIWIPGADGTYDAFVADELEIAFLREPQAIAQAKDDGVRGFSTIQSAGAMLMLNQLSGPASDPRVREALAAAIDPEVVNQRAWEGTGLAGTALIAEQSILYEGLEGPQPDPDRAAELVEEAKADGWDGSLELLCPTDTTAQDICIAIKAQADAAGMNMTIESLTTADLIERVLFERNFEASQFGMNIADAEPWIRLGSFLHSESFVNAGGYQNPDMDEVLGALRVADDVDTRKEAIAEIQALWNEDTPNIVYAPIEEFIAVDDSVRGLKISQDAQIYFDSAFIQE
jgi:peptide/nickel transport system substrate-binding protein